MTLSDNITEYMDTRTKSEAIKTILPIKVMIMKSMEMETIFQVLETLL